MDFKIHYLVAPKLTDFILPSSQEKPYETTRIFTLFLGMMASLNAQVTDTLIMIWNDEFNGVTLDNTKWDHCQIGFAKGKVIGTMIMPGWMVRGI